MMFNDEEPSVEKLDKRFLEAFDPFQNFLFVQLMKSGSFPVLVLRNECADLSELLSDYNLSVERQSRQRGLFTRVMRYFTSEALVKMIAGAPPHGPFYRVNAEMQQKNLTNYIRSISQRKIPNEFSLITGGLKVESFSLWLSLKAFASTEPCQWSDWGEFERLLVEEATLLTKRGVINSFKHCRPWSSTDIGPMRITLNNSEENSLVINRFKSIESISWKKERRGNFSIVSEYEEFDFDLDESRVFCVSVALNAIRKVWLARISGSEQVQVQLPTIDSRIGVPQRFSFTTTFGARQ